jgi:hypothetical protein
LPGIQELLITPAALLPDAATLRHLTGLHTLYALSLSGRIRLELDSLPAGQMRKLALSRWFTKSLVPLERMTGLQQLQVDLFRDPLDPIVRMTDLRYLHVKGPAKGWAKLRECTLLEEAHLIDVQIANLRRWNTWEKLRILTLSGRGVKSLAGLEKCERLEELTLLNLNMTDLAPLRQLQNLKTLALRMVAGELDLSAVAAMPALRTLVIDDAADADLLHLPAIKILARAPHLEELVLFCTIVADGDLMPLSEIPKLRKVRLGSMIGGDVEKLHAARPDIEIDYKAPDPRLRALTEQVGGVTVRKPGRGLDQWSIFQSLAPALKLKTNYDAEATIKRELRKRNPDLAKRLDWDTEAGAMGVYANTEADIKEVAELINELLQAAAGHQHR